MTSHHDSNQRTPGRAWTVRVTGFADRTATVTCTSPCRLPSRSRDVTAIRAFAAAHAAAHARAATPRPNAACHCRIQGCSWHASTRLNCSGQTVLMLIPDPLGPRQGRVWRAAEVCAQCAHHIPHGSVVSTAARPHAATKPAPAAASTPPNRRPASSIPGGFSAPAPATTPAASTVTKAGPHQNRN
ncbi:hypothetical protein ABZW18_26105 [Streptomyces sp. NPDC004647]|uniref:hypothetical protein n=1 Tax=Streptomyces sp. NPDC004647 TaxID=3154671 RepID=UPI0033B7FE03